MNTTQQILNTAVVGCGAISDIYLENMIYHFDNLNVTACCANHLEHAKTKADAYGIKGCTYEEILKDPSIDMVVILTGSRETCVYRKNYDLIRTECHKSAMPCKKQRAVPWFCTGYLSGSCLTDCTESH